VLEVQTATASTHLRELSERALSDPVLGTVFDAIGGYAMVIDQQRRVVAANAELLQLLDLNQGETIVNLLPGDALECRNAKRHGGGCGSSPQCPHCGALLAMLAAQASHAPVEGHCVITREPSGNAQRTKSTDFRVRIVPLVLGGESVHVVVMHDVTAIKWRELQERMFHHDLANMLNGLNGWSDQLLQYPTLEAAAEVVGLVGRLTESLQTHRLIMQCEAGEMRLHTSVVDLAWIAANLQTWFTAHESARDRVFELERSADAQFVETDSTLLLRVLGNLIQNAFEASPKGSTISLRILFTEPRSIRFEVRNPAVIEPKILQQLFKQRVSSKGVGRGLGLYAVQVLGEHLLGGVVDFASSESNGTVFGFTLPVTATSH
jgi:hypothetical protein